MRKLDKKAQANIQGFVMSIVGVAVVLAVGLIVLGELDSATTDGNASAATQSIITKLATIPTWIGILITVALAFIVLSYFYGGKGR